MATVAQLIEKLKNLPQDAEVEVLREYSCGYAMSTEFAPLDLDDLMILDYTDEKWQDSRCFGRVYLHLTAV